MAISRASVAFVFLFIACANICLAAEDDHGHHDDHEGESVSYEWAGVFETPEPTYIWTAQAVDGAYADPKMKIVVLPAAAATEDALSELEAEALHLLGGECVEVEAGGTLIPGETCYDLHFNESHIGQDGIRAGSPLMFCHDLDTTFTIEAGNAANLAFFAEHVPIEFERSQHYLKDAAGEDIEPVAEMSPPKAKPWGLAIGAAIVVNIVTLVGVLMLIPIVANVINKYPTSFAVVTNSFAAGALLAAAFFLLLYEATHLIPITEERSEAAASAAWGCMILLGFMTAPLIEIIGCALLEFFPGSSTQDDTAAKTPEVKTINSGDHENGMKTISIDGETEEEAFQLAARRRRIIGGILIGDFMHNFCDGIFIGSAFNLCGGSMGWVVTSATVYHEIAQELSDFWILTDPKQGAMRPWIALALNFVSGMSVILGVVIILAMDVSSYATGMLLAYGGGVYVHIGAGECMSRVYPIMKTLSLRFTWLISFVVGAAAIGLVLLDHEHCSADGGHDHGH